MTKKNCIKILIVLCTVFLFAAYTAAVKLRKLPQQVNIEAPVRVAVPLLGTAEKTIKLTGFVENDSTVTIFPKVSGTLLLLPIKTGDSVKAGQILCKIDSEPYKFQLNQARAAYLATEAAWERVKNLFAADSVSRQTYDRARAEFEAARSQFNMAQLQYDNTVITSPVRGTVLKIHTAEGNTAAQSLPIVTLGSSEAIKIRLGVPERYFTLFQKKLLIERNNMVAEIPVLNGLRVPAQVQTVAPYISPQTRTFEVECTLTEVGDIRAGMFARIFVSADRAENVFILPYTALTGGNMLWYIENGQAKKMPFTPLFEGDTSFTVPEEYASYQFITEGQHFLKEGDLVRLMQD